MIPEKTLQKQISLKKYIKDRKKAAVAFSGGVDSTFLLKIAHEELGDKVLAYTAVSAFFPTREQNEAKDWCRQEGIRQTILSFSPLDLPKIAENPPDRCYHCKKELFHLMKKEAERTQVSYLMEGSNLDDLKDYRPGLRAIKELQILSPLKEIGFTKKEIRLLSKEMGLPTFDKPSFACLASRFASGEPITAKGLSMVEQAEELLFQKGFHQFRVRMHGNLARIELLPEELETLVKKDCREEITKKLQDYGFRYVTMDLMGYQTGSMNASFG